LGGRGGGLALFPPPVSCLMPFAPPPAPPPPPPPPTRGRPWHKVTTCRSTGPPTTCACGSSRWFAAYSGSTASRETSQRQARSAATFATRPPPPRARGGGATRAPQTCPGGGCGRPPTRAPTRCPCCSNCASRSRNWRLSRFEGLRRHRGVRARGPTGRGDRQAERRMAEERAGTNGRGRAASRVRGPWPEPRRGVAGGGARGGRAMIMRSPCRHHPARERGERRSPTPGPRPKGFLPRCGGAGGPGPVFVSAGGGASRCGRFAGRGQEQGETRSNNHWSSSTYRNNENNAWNVDFNDGNTNANNKTNGYAVRAVRAGS
jgi:hypothetical protein